MGVLRLRSPVWADPMDHIKIDIVNNEPGPWLHLYSPFNLRCNGRDPVDFIHMMPQMKTDINECMWEIYKGPLPESTVYKKAAQRFGREPL